MKHRKKWAGAAIAAFVALGMLGTTVPASAAPTDKAGITITGASADEREFIAYRIATYDQVWIPESGGDAKLVRVNLETDGDLIDDLAEWLEGQTNKETRKYEQNVDGDPLMWIAENWESDGQTAWHSVESNKNVRALANWLTTEWLADSDNKSELEAATPPEANEGLHLVLETKGDDKGTSRSLPIIIGTKYFKNGLEITDLDKDLNQPDAEINVKGDLVTIDKDIVQACDANEPVYQDGDPESPLVSGCGFAAPGSGLEVEDSWTATTGDVLDFVIRTNVPHYPGTFGTAVFEIHDSWTGGLSAPIMANHLLHDAGNSLVVMMNGQQNLTLGTHYTYEHVSESTEFQIKFSDPRALGGAEITVTYKATVLAGGELNADTYTHDTNAAHVTFTSLWSVDSNGDGIPDGGPGNTTDDTVKDEVDVYTFPLDIRKADLNNNAKFLEAEFLVLDADDHVLGMIKTSTDGEAAYITGVQVVGGSPITDNTTKYDENKKYEPTATTPKGLAGNAWYQVIEHTAPVDYTAANLDVAKFWVYINADHAEGGDSPDDGGIVNPLEYYFAGATGTGTPGEYGTHNAVYVHPTFDGGGVQDDKDNDMTVVVLNAKLNSDMPSTGGQILLIAGLAGVLGLGGLTFGAVGLRKRKLAAAAVQAA